MRTVAGLFVGGVALVIVLKLVGALVLPLVAILFGLIALAIKLAIVIAVGWFAYSYFRNRSRELEV